MIQDMEKDVYLLFNLAFDGLDKTDLSNSKEDEDLADIQSYILSQEEKPQVAVIHTRNKLYPKALLFRKMVKGKAVLFAFWKRGSVCEGMAASLDGVSVLNEFIWVQDAATGKFKATLKPKIDVTQKKERQAMLTRVAVSSVVVEPLNRSEYKEKFNGDILKKLQFERMHLLDSMKKRNLIPADAPDPIHQAETPVSAGRMMTSPVEKRSEFVAVQKDGAMTFTTQTVDGEGMANKLARELEREARLADREEEKLAKELERELLFGGNEE